MPQFSLSEEVQLEDFTETYESKYGVLWMPRSINIHMDVLTFLKRAATISYPYLSAPQYALQSNKTRQF